MPRHAHVLVCVVHAVVLLMGTAMHSGQQKVLRQHSRVLFEFEGGGGGGGGVTRELVGKLVGGVCVPCTISWR